MHLLSYFFKDGPESSWKFSPIRLKKVNLLVGPTGSGKSRLLNSLFNVAQFIHSGNPFRSGVWEISFRANNVTYRWNYEGVQEGEDAFISQESLCSFADDGTEVPIYDRSPTSFTFKGQSLPKLSKTSPAIFLLREEDQIAPVYENFALILRRSFWGPDLQESCKMSNLPNELLTHSKDKGKRGKEVKQFLLNLPLGARLFVLRENERGRFNDLVEQYRAVFPSIESVDFTDGTSMLGAPAQGKAPVLTVKERGVAHPVLLHDLSSGMQKVLLILTDVMTMAKGTVYLIDEYENSLGINAVNFLPAFLSEFGEDSQFLITSHHPYLINSTPMANWSVFKRHGSDVRIEPGEELALKYGSSKQDAFIQLLNDPEFSGGNI